MKLRDRSMRIEDANENKSQIMSRRKFSHELTIRFCALMGRWEKSRRDNFNGKFFFEQKRFILKSLINLSYAD